MSDQVIQGINECFDFVERELPKKVENPRKVVDIDNHPLDWLKQLLAVLF